MGKQKQTGASKKGRQHTAHERSYLKQYDRTARNKERARERHLQDHPNDLKAREAIKKARKRDAQ